MTCLALRLAAPLQSWGASSRFVRRTTEPWPTKSALVGLFAAAMGRRRVDPIEDLLELRFGIRVDQPGQLLRDFQTARSLDGARTMPLSTRYYLADAVFLAVVGGPEEILEPVSQALQRPAFPLYLGRRSCPPAGRFHLGLRDDEVFDVLRNEPWLASASHRSRFHGNVVQLDAVVDADAVPSDHDAPGVDLTVRDEPVSFDPELRQYEWRRIVRTSVRLDVGGSANSRHDPFAIVGG